MGSSDSLGNDVPGEKALCSQGLGDKEHPHVYQAAGKKRGQIKVQTQRKFSLETVAKPKPKFPQKTRITQ